jgi:general secretion pathway protein A
MNYLKILDLNKEPFANTPDPDIFYQSRQHLGCLQRLELSIRLRRGLNVVVGAVGAGKTTICRQLIRRLARDEEFETHLIMDPGFSRISEFLAFVAGMFPGVEVEEGAPDLAVKEAIKQYLFRRSVEEGRTVVLIVDEGQKMPGFGLEILREFLNYETNEHKLLQIVIFAQEEFEGALKDRQNFVDRINVYERLTPLDFRDTRALVRYRLEVSSNTAATLELFTTGALWVIYRAGRGYPRKIVNLCHQCVLSLIVKDRKRVDFRLARACAKRLAAARPGQGREHSVRPGLAWAAVAVMVSALVLGLARSPLPDMAGDYLGAKVPALAGMVGITTEAAPETRVSKAAVLPTPVLPMGGVPAKPETPGAPAREVMAPAGPEKARLEQVLPTEIRPTAPAYEEASADEEVSADAEAGAPVVAAALAEPDGEAALMQSIDREMLAAGPVTMAAAPAPMAAGGPTGAAAGPKKELGRVTVQAKESLSRFCWLVYGSYDEDYVAAMMAANPQLDDPNRIKIGENLTFPVMTQAKAVAPGYWLELGRGQNLDGAMDVVRAQGQEAWTGLRIVPQGRAGEGLTFAVIYRGSFQDETSAREALDRLTPAVDAEVKVVGVKAGENDYLADPRVR